MSRRTPPSTRLLLGGIAGGAGLLLLRTRRRRQLSERVAAAALESLLYAIDANDRETGQHVRRVATYALILARAAGLDEHQRRDVERVALFHDIGKIDGALFDIVHDGQRLSEEERRLIATHPARGAAVLRPLAAFYPELPRGVIAHHERWDGSGYPRGLRGLSIPPEARIVSIADAFDAVVHGRRYQRSRGLPAGAEMLAAGRGRQFDPDLVDLFLLPPVFAEVSTATRRALHPAARHRRGEGEDRADSAPDITFRWRSESAAPRPRDPEPRTPT